MKKIAILTTFYDFDPSYSLCHCVEDQLKMFIRNGYSVRLIVDAGFNYTRGIWGHEKIEIFRTSPVQRSNEGELNEKWKEDAEKMTEDLKNALDGIDTVITHDIVLQPAHIIWNYALRVVAQERTDVKFLHWSHSPTSPIILCNIQEVSQTIQYPFPRSLYCYPNDYDRKRVAINYSVELDKVKCVHHPSDISTLLFGELIDNPDGIPKIHTANYAKKLAFDMVEEFKLLEADVVASYAARLDRGKQPEFLIKTMASMKKNGKDVRCIIFDFSSTGGDKVVYRQEMEKIGSDLGLILGKELVFISQWRPETSYSVPRETIMLIKRLCDFHMHPSNTETYSLVVQEAMISRNFCVLNYHTPMMADIYGSKNMLFEGFGASFNMLNGENGNTTLNIHDEEQHFMILANKIMYFLENDPVVAQFRFIRKQRNLDYVFKNELEPLLYATI